MLVAVLILLAGKILFLPVAFLVDRDHFYIALASYTGFRGALVLSCWDRFRTACVLSNAIPPGHSPSYYVLASAPWWALAVVLAVLVLGAASLGWPPRPSRSSALGVLLALLLAFNFLAIGSSFVDQGSPRISIPLVGLRESSFDVGRGLYTATFDVGVYEMRSASCSLGDGTPLDTSLNGSVVEARIPEGYFGKLYENITMSPEAMPSPPASIHQGLIISCTIQLDEGMLEHAEVLSFNWVEPLVEANGSVITIRNGNPVPLNLTVVIQKSTQIVSVENVTLGPMGAWSRDLSRQLPQGDYDVRVYYVFLGVPRGVSVHVRIP
ncbi:MAG: hypothetical protein ABWK00_07075 [Desulfurococcaceae archaeon]